MNASPHAVVILGGSGFIGGRLAQRLRQTGADIHAFSSVDCDLRDPQQTRRVLGSIRASSIVLCSGVSRTVEDSWRTFQTNLAFAHNLIHGLADQPPENIVFLSSSDVYGLPAAELPITEQTLPRPTTLYGLAKLASETLLRLAQANAWNGQTCPVTCFRLPGIYGAGDQGRSVIGAFCQQIGGGQSVTITGDGDAARDFVHVDDLCQVIEHALANPQPGGVYNVASGVTATPLEAARCIASQLHKELSVVHAPANPDRDHDLVFDVGRLREFAPQVGFRSIAEGVEDYLSGAGRA